MHTYLALPDRNLQVLTITSVSCVLGQPQQVARSKFGDSQTPDPSSWVLSDNLDLRSNKDWFWE